MLGSRGHGGLPALLGSVSAHCAASSACPTLVVRS
ncbi:MAG: universal stress protein [Kribbellaceae bacterium]